ncbi:hypothetical protein D8B26_003021 [Coccidioides posadasii str. Silveira]|uniref:Predicted protein n=1 Tax=Coccidioides posadasii (strain RMSCC 757 / Silveira) TaxID=443226 RepID=E9CXG4_COCPS|nr:predicted protein [Coccidioides posadasii str. Silveira]QVM08330.1 hypothetical protein D8B26_003021 [Coccidioides posadasii str. Silveira]
MPRLLFAPTLDRHYPQWHLYPTHYEAYKVKYTLAMQDPEETETRYHTVIFIVTDDNGDGYIHHVTGDITAGMTYQPKQGKQPETSQTFHRKEFLGLVQKSKYPDEVNRVCMSVPPPHAQKRFNPQTMRYEQFKPDGSFYAPGERRPKYFKCTEWTETKAIPALFQAGVLEQGAPLR